MSDHRKEVKKGSQSNHVSAVKPSPTAKKKSNCASEPFADEAKEEERAWDSDSLHGEVHDEKDYYSKEVSQYDHVRAVKPSIAAKKKSNYASVPFADEAKEEERVWDSEVLHGKSLDGKKNFNHRVGSGSNILQQDSSARVEHEEPGVPPQTLPGAVAVGGSGRASRSADDEWSLDESQGINEQPLAMHGIEEGQQEAVNATLVDESTSVMPATVAVLDAEAEAKARNRRNMINIMVSCGLTSIVAIVAAVVAVVLTGNKSGNETLAPSPLNPTSIPPSPSPTSVLFPFLSENSFDNGNALLTDGSPQQQAMIWLESQQGTAEIMDSELLQIYALVTLYYATSGDQWPNQDSNDQFNSRFSWLFSINNYCNWFGLTCNVGQIMSIDLTNNTLMGSIPPEIGLLSRLESIALASNAINGSLPIELGLLTSITELLLFQNQLTGPIPIELGQLANITTFRIFGNNFTGTIPTEIGLMSALTTLSLGKNNFTGTVPTEVCSISPIQIIFVCPPLTCNCSSSCKESFDCTG